MQLIKNILTTCIVVLLLVIIPGCASKSAVRSSEEKSEARKSRVENSWGRTKSEWRRYEEAERKKVSVFEKQKKIIIEQSASSYTVKTPIGVAGVRGTLLSGTESNQKGDPLLSKIPYTGRLFKSDHESLNAGIFPPANFDELWIIEKPEPVILKHDDDPTQGELRTLQDGKLIDIPLEHTEVHASISGFVSTVTVKQKYHNPWDIKIEAEYVFPLPQDSAVTDFIMIVGDREIRGMIREKEEAKRIYENAKSQGYRAALLTQERPNIFKQKIANIEPKKKIDIQLTYFNPLKYSDGQYQFVFPMVVGPRFNPEGTKNPIHAVPRNSKRGLSKGTITPYLKPNERSGHDISVNLEVNAGVEIESIESPSHAVNIKSVQADHVVQNETPVYTKVVSLKEFDRIPNKDFIVNFKVAGEKLKTAFLSNKSSGDEQGTFAMVLHPPKDSSNIKKMPREMIFVMDCSGSMRGTPLNKVKDAMKRCLQNLDHNDTFQIIRFSDRASSFGSSPVIANKANIHKAMQYIANTNGGGGTRMIEGIKAALDFPHDDNRLRIVSFMTDGYIGNENQILAAIHQKLGSSRIFSFGIGSSVNRYLMERMASFGKGAVAYVGLDARAGREVDLFYERVAYPVLTDVEINWGGMEVSDVYPKIIPDLFVGRPLVIAGKFKGQGPQTIHISGRSGDRKITWPVEVNLNHKESQHPGIAKIWARWKIKELHNHEMIQPSEQLKQEIMETSLSNSIISQYTAFVAVDGTEKTLGKKGISVQVPLNVPDGVSYETTVTPNKEPEEKKIKIRPNLY